MSDNTKEEIPEEQPTNTFTLVKTFGDFNNTYSNDASSNMLLVYTNKDGKEYAMEAGKLYEVSSKVGASGYRTISTVADHVLIPNNNSGTSSNFNIDTAEVKESNTFVFATPYAFRKNRQNETEDKNYLTMNNEPGGLAWTKNDDIIHDDGLVYVLTPTKPVYSVADYDNSESYTLSVIRDGSVAWLGVAPDEDDNLQMVVVDSEEDAAKFNVYTDNLRRYYASANSTDLYRYYRITSVTDINANDEIIIAYDDNGTKRIIGLPFIESSVTDTYSSSSHAIAPLVKVLDEYSLLNTRFEDPTTESKYLYRLDTTEAIKKPFAYKDPAESSIIWAQGVSANVIGTAKSESNKQRKYDYVSALSYDMRYALHIKNDKYATYSNRAEVNFFPSDTAGEFYIRGGKGTTWLGLKSYTRDLLSLETGEYEPTGSYLTPTTVNKDDRISVEVYRRPATSESFSIQYYDLDKTLNHSELKPQETFTLTQSPDIEENGIKYAFVGWTADPEKSKLLTISESSNLYDYNDVEKYAALKTNAKEELGLIGACNPEIENLIEFEEVEEFVEDGVLKVYPVYAVKGFSAAVTANENGKMIIGASDVKDLEDDGTGSINERERWLGSINIEVYKDGELWVPGNGESTIGKKTRNSNGGSEAATLYFAYHNDNAADLNIKFIADTVTQDTLYEYMSNEAFDQTEPTGNYLIDAVWAEQGGSEDGLKYKYNWMTSDLGGQLDNVKGGSTVKIFITTKYQVKYYFDDDDKGYDLLTGSTYTNNNFYTTPGTDNAVLALKESNTDYYVTPDNDYVKLIERTPTSPQVFVDEKISRGDYSEFLYKFDEYGHTFHVPELPDAPEGRELDNTKWVIRNDDLEALSEYTPDSDFSITGTSYGTGNTVWAHKANADATNTYHLYAKVAENKYNLIVEKNVSGNIGDKSKDWAFEVTFTPKEGSSLPESYAYEKGSSSGTLTVSENKVSFTLKDGESITIKEIVKGTKFSVSELEANEYGYKTTSTYATGEIVDSDVTVTFANNRAVVVPTGITRENNFWLPIMFFGLTVACIIIFKKTNPVSEEQEKVG